MRTTYAVAWQAGAGESRAGKLELRDQGLVFEGSNGEGPSVTEVPFDDVSAVRVARRPADRLGGRPTLVLERRGTAPIRIASVAQTGIVAELAERLARALLARIPSPSRFAVVVPLQGGAQERAGKLLRAGPPFELAASGLNSHQVFLSDSEAIFYFETDTPEIINRLAGDPHVWTVASEWKDLISGPPRIAQGIYSWLKPDGPPVDATFAATPGPGDSDGGDLFEP